MRKEKRLLIVGSGGLRGAYSAGVLSELYKKIKPEYFDDILACSAGAYSSSYYLAGQIKEMEHIWRNMLDGKKFFCVEKKLQKKSILDLDYLCQLMTDGNLGLNVKKIISSQTNLKYVLTEYKTGAVVYLGPQKNNILKLITGSSSIFPLYGPVKINGKEYVDGAFNEPIPFDTKFVKKYNKILIIQNFNRKKTTTQRNSVIFKALAHLTPQRIDKIIDHHLKNVKNIEMATKHKNILLLSPSRNIPLKSTFDTNKKRLNATFDLGVKDAKKAINFLEK